MEITITNYSYYINFIVLQNGLRSMKNIGLLLDGRRRIEFSNNFQEEWNSGQGRVVYEILAMISRQNFRDTRIFREL